MSESWMSTDTLQLSMKVTFLWLGFCPFLSWYSMVPGTTEKLTNQMGANCRPASAHKTSCTHETKHDGFM